MRVGACSYLGGDNLRRAESAHANKPKASSVESNGFRFICGGFAAFESAVMSDAQRLISSIAATRPSELIYRTSVSKFRLACALLRVLFWRCSRRCTCLRCHWPMWLISRSQHVLVLDLRVLPRIAALQTSCPRGDGEGCRGPSKRRRSGA